MLFSLIAASFRNYMAVTSMSSNQGFATKINGKYNRAQLFKTNDAVS